MVKDIDPAIIFLHNTGGKALEGEYPQQFQAELHDDAGDVCGVAASGVRVNASAFCWKALAERTCVGSAGYAAVRGSDWDEASSGEVWNAALISSRSSWSIPP